MNTDQIKIHVGCGQNYIPGWKNIDIFSSVKADLYADLSALPFDRNSVDELYCCHCLEHCHRATILATLGHWLDILKPGGRLRVAVPDFAACVKWYNETKDLTSIIGLIWGGQTHPKNNHFIGFDVDTLGEALRKVGFKHVKTYDWRDTDHADFDDYSQAFLPFDPITRKPLSKTHGLLASLNMQGTK